ncbi:hypothetical protein BDB00DRAFT_786326 [Zychaea mexicana]|uniref:uncharacterized protein n=1 Tax=Zychaea mexicana TaxID=64656 RepID=UPI0022FDB65C|nr:uncharacterized protein BDB00DRAFT_786326 [Zychaea mexicana]KAI9495524.1 hypothetical protein BDB00DRAFT_786326 [Zychaea mexicana]
MSWHLSRTPLVATLIRLKRLLGVDFVSVTNVRERLVWQKEVIALLVYQIAISAESHVLPAICYSTTGVRRNSYSWCLPEVTCQLCSTQVPGKSRKGCTYEVISINQVLKLNFQNSPGCKKLTWFHCTGSTRFSRRLFFSSSTVSGTSDALVVIDMIAPSLKNSFAFT